MRLLILGTGGHARVVHDIIRGEMIDYHDCFRQFCEPPFFFTVGVGDNAKRKEIFLEAVCAGGVPYTAVHHSATISRPPRIGIGSVVCAGAIIQVGAKIGVNCILNTSCSVDHDCVIWDHCHIAPGARLCGSVRVGKGTLIGAGAVVLPKICIGDNCIIGAGSVVIEDVPSGATVKGNPAR